MGNTIRAIGLSLCALVGSALPQDSLAFYGQEFGPFCGDRFGTYYTVQSGDNLWKIAKRVYGSTMEFSYESGRFIHLPQVLAKANGLSHAQVYVGQELFLPRAGIEEGGLCPTNMKARRVSEYEDVRTLGEL